MLVVLHNKDKTNTYHADLNLDTEEIKTIEFELQIQ